MAQTNFYLKNPNQTGETLIYLFFSYDNQRLKLSTSEKVEPKNWNLETQRVKRNVSGFFEINNRLEQIEGEIKRIYREALLKKEIPTNELLKDRLNEILNPKKAKTYLDFSSALTEFIEAQKHTKTSRTIQKYETLKTHLKNFGEKTKTSIQFESVNARFYEDLVNYFIVERKMVNNSIAKYIKTLKTFMHWAIDRGYTDNNSFRKFKATEKDADIVYLTEKELFKLYDFDFSDSPTYEKVRDVFCFGCFTGLRFSDIARVSKDKIINDEIRIVSEKTTNLLYVPLNEYSKEILEKYNYKLPVISNQKTNEHLKKIAEKAEINELVTLTKFRGAEEVKTCRPKYEFLGTHTARRTFVTLSLEKGMRVETTMSIVGHKEYNTFKKYVVLTNKVKSLEMNTIWKRN